MKIIELKGTCDGAGALTLEAPSSEVGFIEKIVMDYIDGDTGADIVVTNEDGTVSTAVMTKANLGVADVTFQPRAECNKVSDGAAFVNFGDKIFVTGKMKIVIAAGGVSKQFRFIVTLSDAV